jgi:hypothetical protein
MDSSRSQKNYMITLLSLFALTISLSACSQSSVSKPWHIGEYQTFWISDTYKMDSDGCSKVKIDYKVEEKALVDEIGYFSLTMWAVDNPDINVSEPHLFNLSGSGGVNWYHYPDRLAADYVGTNNDSMEGTLHVKLCGEPGDYYFSNQGLMATASATSPVVKLTN